MHNPLKWYGITWLIHNPVLRNQMKNAKQTQQPEVRNQLGTILSTGRERAEKTRGKYNHKGYTTSWRTHNPLVWNLIENTKQIQQSEVRNQLASTQSSGMERAGKHNANTTTVVRTQLENNEIQQPDVQTQLANTQSSGWEPSGKQSKYNN
ncbi:hypothetical protein CHS0354_024969 [Potamilus streckersoni]|uniref:Uncharacterized protein n=1 Tax=Potamilus streckersoni TaxID=2493646 RepID=A0AAE0T2K9_9BIVA|nr:hypothetical protein CHS0354_024969 [Potamilus streckersoni]